MNHQKMYSIMLVLYVSWVSNGVVGSPAFAAYDQGKIMSKEANMWLLLFTYSSSCCCCISLQVMMFSLEIYVD